MCGVNNRSGLPIRRCHCLFVFSLLHSFAVTEDQNLSLGSFLFVHLSMLTGIGSIEGRIIRGKSLVDTWLLSSVPFAV